MRNCVIIMERSFSDLADNKGIISRVMYHTCAGEYDKPNPCDVGYTVLVFSIYAHDNSLKTSDAITRTKYNLNWPSGKVRIFKTYAEAEAAALDFGYLYAEELGRIDTWQKPGSSIFDLTRD